MKAITTKYHGPTNTKGARITASDSDGNRATISYPYELSGEAVHRAAADQLCGKMGWSNDLIGGAVRGGYVFVFTGDRSVYTCRVIACDQPVKHQGAICDRCMAPFQTVSR